MGARATATGGTARGARNALGAFARIALLLAAIVILPVPADGALAYGDAFDFDVAAGHAGELRVQLFKKHASALAPNAKTVVANAGVYVKNIVSHIAAHGDIDKDFKLFSKGGEASGGFVRLRVAFEEDAAGDAGAGDAGVAAAPAGTRGDENADPAETEAAQKAAAKIQASWKGKKTRDFVRSGRENNNTNANKNTNGVSPASVAKACGVVAVAAFAASVRVTRGRRRRSAA